MSEPGFPVDGAATVAMALARCLNGLGLLAAPRAWTASVTQGAEGDLRAGILEALEASVEALAGQGPPLSTVTADLEPQQAGAHLEQVLEAARSWEHGAPPDELVDLARGSLALLGVPEPPDGWDSFAPDGA